MPVVTRTVEETFALGRALGRLAPPGTCVALEGQLGAGKTHLTHGIAQGAGVDDPTLVSSPTYVLLNVYAGPKPVFHLDAYRVTSEEDFAAVGFEELLAGRGVVVVEWPSRIAALLPADRLVVTIEPGEEEGERVWQVEGTGPESRRLAEALAAEWGGG
jgi:tRNA threonylcarbamoyladenosine biosynthesis protein TsaE